jgi:hypothetical protein
VYKKYKNKGAPKREVKIPTGITIGSIKVLEKMSANNKRDPPLKIERGIIYLWEEPAISLTR